MLELIRHPVWIFDVDQHKIWWANRAALAFWRAESLSDLLSRSFDTDSPTVRRRLQTVIDCADQDHPSEESWTLYPGGEPISVRITMTPVRIDDDRRDAVLIEALVIGTTADDPDALRLLEATRYTSVMISYFRFDGQLIAMNPAAVRIYGNRPKRCLADHAPGSDTGPSEVLVKPAAFERRFVDPGTGTRLLRQCQRHGELTGEFRVAAASGPRWHKIETRLARDPATGEPTILLIEEDVTERRDALQALERINQTLEETVAHRTAALRDALQQAEMANRSKSDFLARMSHDLRTPLNAILGFSEILANPCGFEDSGARSQTYGGFIHGAAQSLLELINDLLDLSRIEAGHYPVRSGFVEVQAKIDGIVSMLSGQFQDKGVALTVDCPQPLPVRTDSRAVGLILDNLMSNALKFTPQGGAVSVAGQADGGSAVTISISDTGIGIGAADLSRIFDPYERGRADIADKTEGTGLGLAISQRLAGLLGGSLRLESVPGSGTTATLRLPVAPPVDAAWDSAVIQSPS